MKNLYFILLFLGFSMVVSGQDLGGTPVEGLIAVKRISSSTEKTATSTKATSTTAKTAAATTTPAPTGPSQEVGITEGQLSVSLSGAATYSIPIAVPPGINGVVPQVSLVYSSQGGNGMAGYGWNISGVSAITRIPRTKFHDGVVGGVNLDASDGFALDGQRLILKSETPNYSDAIVYETESFSNIKITAVDSPSGSNYGPDSFVVEYPDGSKAEYGATVDSRSINTWGITYWENPQGVRISYSYTLANNLLRLASINYGSTGTNQTLNKIELVYRTIPRQRPEESYIGGQRILMDKILCDIKVWGNNVGFRNYVLGHNTTSLGYERLTSITEKSGDNTKSYNPTVFSYEGTTDTISYTDITTDLGIENITSYNTGTISGDFDGDDKMEFIIYPTTGTSSKSKYWLFSEFTAISNNLNFGQEHNVGPFETIFPVSWLTWNNKLPSKQGWAVAKKTDTNYNFTVYCAGITSPIYYQYESVVNFPTLSVGVYENCKIVKVNKIFPKKIISGDFNGDGLTDVITIDKDYLTDYITADCSGANGNLIYSKKVYFVDLKRDNTTNFLTYSGELLANITTNTKVEVADVNGDGKSDFLIFENGKVTTYTLNGTNQLVLLWNYADTNISIESNKTILLGDYNGDGKTDFIIPKGAAYSEWYKYTSTGVGFTKLIQDYSGFYYATDNSVNTRTLIPTDYNNDGKTDLLWITSSRNQDNTWGRIGVAFYINKDNTFSYNNSIYQSTGDKAELNKYALPIYIAPNQSNRKLEIAIISDKSIYKFQSQKDFSKEKLLKTITTGNGVKESITYQSLSPDSLSDDGYTPIYTPSLFTENYPQTDIESATNLQVVTKLEKLSANVFKKQLFSYAGATSNMEGLGFLGFRASMRTNWFDDTSTEPSTSQIISSISKFDPNLRGANVANYTYLGLYNPTIAVNTAAPNTPRKSAITINDARTGQETIVATNSIRFLPGAIISPTGTNIFKAQITPDYDANGFTETNTTPPSNLISKSLSFYEASLSATKVYTLQNTQSNTYNILENTSSETVTVYDSFNNPTESISKIRNVGVGEQTTTTSIAYKTPLTTPYLIGRPDSKIQTVSITGDIMTSKEVYGYGTGTESNLLKKIEKWGNNTNVLIEDNIYDSFGNITKKTITANGLTPRVTNYEYNPSSPYNGRFLTKSIDIEGLETVFTYNSDNGNLMTELLPSKPGYPLLTTYVYNDPWFKKTKTIDYLGKSNTYAYSQINSVNTLVTTAGDDGSYSEEVFDDLGRKITSGVRDISGNTSKVSYLYDVYDRNIKASEPYFGTGATQWNETKYDEYGRTKQNISFTLKTVSVSYSGLTTTVNDGTKRKISTKNAIGNVVRMTDQPGGIIDYTYFANGNLKTTSYGGVITTIEQDGWGRKTKLTDPSAGTYTYAYNDFGETTSETTPNGTTTYAINAVGKLTTKTISGNNTNSSTTYNYNGTTKLLDSSTFTNTLEASTVTTNTFTYDNYKRLVGTTEVTPYATFIKTIDKFDDFGRVEIETTSGTAHGKTSSKTIKNTYLNGYAWQIFDNVSQQVLWKTNTVNARGQLLTADLGNGIAITNEYDLYGFAAQFKHEKTGASPANIMTLITTFDEKKGNLKSRNHNIFNWIEDFTSSYDNLDRLTSYKNAQGAIETQTYNEDGRIDVNTLGKYNYSNTAKKYQNTSITLTPDARTYYQNRGIAAIPSPTAARALNITYNTFKSPVEIKEDGVDNLSFVYNDNNDRSAMFYGSTNPDKNLRPNRKYYSADGSMEIKATFAPGNTTNPTAVEFVTYIGGDGYSAPIVLKSDGTTQKYLYLHRDYQGSILVITDANAAVLEKRLFDAWGAILKVQNGAGVDLNVLTILDRGYTGHEHLQSVGLINMNGRIYDPKLHRFLQPDNYVQDPYNTQNYNRYGYCWNNPLKFTDPSGEWIWIVVGAVIGGTINWIAHGATFDARGLTAFGIGAGAGALAALTGGAAFAGAGGAAGGIGGFIAGAAGGAAGAAASQTFLTVGNHVAFGDPLMTPKEFFMGVAFGAVLGGFINASQVPKGNNIWNGNAPPTKVQAITIKPAGLARTGTPEIKTDAKLPSTTQTSTAPTTQTQTASKIKITTIKNPDGSNSFKVEGAGIVDDGVNTSVEFSTSSTSMAPSRNYTIYEADGTLNKFGVTDDGFKRMNQSLKMAGKDATAIFSEKVPKFQAHMNETYMRSLHYNSTGNWKINGMTYPYPRNFDTGIRISKP